MAEFARLHIIVGEDLTKSLLALHSDLEASSEVLVSDVVRTVGLHPNDPAARQLKAVLQTYQQGNAMKITLPLMELQAAHGDLEEFMQSHLRELSLQTKSQELIGVLCQKLANHSSWVQELVLAPELMEEEVSLQVLIGLGAHIPLEANFFPGILEGLAGRLSLAPPGMPDPPTSVQEGMACHWAAALRESLRKTEGRDIDLGQAAATVAPVGLHLDYDLDFQNRRVDDVAPTLMSPVLSGLVGSLDKWERPRIPEGPTPFQADENLWGLGGVSPKIEVPGPSHDDDMASRRPASKGEVLEAEPSGQGESPWDKPLSEPDPEQVADVVILESNDDLTLEVAQPEAASTPRSEPAQCWKRSPEDQDPQPLPPKKQATWEDEESTPDREAALPRGVKMEHILPKRYETLAADNPWVHWMRCSLLGLEAGMMPSKEDINNSEWFAPRVAAWESELPKVITDHWLPILQAEGLLVECHPDQFTAEPDWVPLYTKDSLQKHLPSALSTFVNVGLPSLTAVVPPGFHMGTDKEFLLMNFHQPVCLVRQSISIGGRCRQMAFCPYCRIINENWETTLSHVRKHLDLLFICGNCYSKSFANGPALHKHMKSQCCSVTAIRDNLRSSQR